MCQSACERERERETRERGRGSFGNLKIEGWGLASHVDDVLKKTILVLNFADTYMYTTNNFSCHGFYQ